MNLVTIESLLSKPVCMMTGEELSLLLQHYGDIGKNGGCRLGVADNGTAMVSAEVTPVSKRYVYGVAGIAETFGCSIPTANRIKASGVIDDAITQVGRKIIVDSDLALKLAKEAKANGIDAAKGSNCGNTLKK